MAGLNDNLDKANKLLKQIEVIYKRLGETNPFNGMDPEKISTSEKEIKKLEVALEGITNKAYNLEEGFGGITAAISASLKEMSKTDSAASQVVKSMRGIKGITNSLADDQAGLTRLSLKELRTQQDKLASLSKTAKLQSSALREEFGLSSKNEKLNSSQLAMRLNTSEKFKHLREDEKNKIMEILQAENEGLPVLDEASKKVAERIKHEEKINKQLGVAGGLLKGLSKIPILGDVFNADEALTAMRDNIETSKSPVKALGAGFKNIGKQITEGVLNPANLVLTAFTFFIKALVQGDKQVGEMAKSLNLTYQEANKVRGELTQMAQQSEYTAVTTSRMAESLSTINSTFGTTAKISKENLETFSLLRDTAGMTNEEIISLYSFSKLTGKELKDSTESFQASAKAAAFQANVAINTKKLMADISKTSKRFQLSIEGGEAGLAKAMVNAKLLGVEMGTVESIADSLLDFESSIEAELSAELLLGKNINLEKARQAALSNDLATLASEISREAGSAAEFNKMNRIQQEALAKAVGMTASGLSDALFEQEALASLGKQLNDDEKRAFETLKEKYGVEEATKRIKEGQLESLVAQQSTAEKFQDIILQVQEIFVGMVEPVLSLVNGIANMVGGAENLSRILKIIAGAYIAIRGAQATISTYTKLNAMRIAGIASMEGTIALHKRAQNMLDLKGLALGKSKLIQLAAQAALWALANPLTALTLGIAAGAGIYAATKAYMKDGVIGPGGEMVVSGPKGSIQLDKDDSIIAGTNLFDKNKSKSSPTSQSPSGGSSNVKIDMTQTNALLQQLINLIQTGGNVILDGQKVGTALKLGSFKTQ
jgi:hypothetical protein